MTIAAIGYGLKDNRSRSAATGQFFAGCQARIRVCVAAFALPFWQRLLSFIWDCVVVQPSLPISVWNWRNIPYGRETIGPLGNGLDSPWHGSMDSAANAKLAAVALGRASRRGTFLRS